MDWFGCHVESWLIFNCGLLSKPGLSLGLVSFQPSLFWIHPTHPSLPMLSWSPWNPRQCYTGRNYFVFLLIMWSCLQARLWDKDCHGGAKLPSHLACSSFFFPMPFAWRCKDFLCCCSRQWTTLPALISLSALFLQVSILHTNYLSNRSDSPAAKFFIG